jgi:hypothetical protein
MTAVDPKGSYLVFMVEGHPSGGARLFQVLLDEVRGIVEFDVYSTNRSKLRSFLRKLTENKSTGAVEVDADIGRGLLRRIAALHPQDRPLPRGFSEWRRKLEEGAAEVTAGERLLERAGAEIDPATMSDEERMSARDRASARVRDSALGPWPPPVAFLAEATEKLDEDIDAALGLESDARAAALEAALSSATERMFSGDHGVQTASRLEASAYVSWKADRLEEARDLMAAAAGFRSDEVANNSVARAMLEICAASSLKRVEDDSQGSGEDSIPDSES